METEWYNGGLEDLLDGDANASNNNASKWGDGAGSARPSLGSLHETLPMDQATLAVVEDKRGRRKSWHIKMERKRRKGVMGSLTPPDKGFQREKRPSWWNIFVPEHWPNRSRRASQDVSSSNENTPPWPRSKSRSVDHGFSPPFDLDSLRNKVEGRFESVDKLARDGEGKDGAPMAEKKVSRIMPPLNTITYTVSGGDTLTSVAARFDTTPSELAKLNRMSCKLVFPGQQLYVPDKRGDADAAADAADAADVQSVGGEQREAADAAVADERDLLDSLRPNSPHHMDQSTAAPTPAPSDSQLHKPSEQRFLKINVRHITDGQGVVGGVLLVTPNAVMFDPNVSDPLVMERGPEAYGVIAPMEYVVNVAIYHDIAHMRVGHADHHRPDLPKPEIYHARSTATAAANHGLGVREDSAFPELSRARSSEEEDNESVCSCAPRDGAAFPKAFERDLVTPTNLAADEDAGSRQVSFESTSSRQKSVEEREDAKNLDSFHSAEERRRSCLDHHWAVPSRDRSLDKEAEHEPQPHEVETEAEAEPEENVAAPLAKHSCHDSGIDIRDSADPGLIVMPTLPPPPIAIPTKRMEEDSKPVQVYSDAEIILASKGEFVPPVASSLPGFNASTSLDSNSGSTGGGGGGGLEPAPAPRKKTSSVSFSVDSNPDADNSGSGGEDSLHRDDPDKQESRKNKMLKRLSYPLAWMEGLTSDSKDEKDVVASLPVDPQTHASMFSKVFSSSPISLVEFGSGLFKTPSEERPVTPTPPLSAHLPAPHAPLDVVFTDQVGRSSVGTYMREPRSQLPKPPAPKLDYRSMVSVDDMPELFVSFDIHAPKYPLLDGLELIPRPARSCEDPPLYLRLRMGKPIDRKIPKSTPIMSYGKKKMRPEYWFSVPRNRVDDLYALLQLWVPHLYGELEPTGPASRGFELVESDTELWDDADAAASAAADAKSADRSPEGELGELTRESWEAIKAPYVKLYSFVRTQTMFPDFEPDQPDEVLSMSEELRRALYATSANSIDLEPFLPDLLGTTEILTEEHRRKLCRNLPARAEGYMWTLVFSTSQHGFSLNSMYRKMMKIESPILMVVEDTEGNVFGALTSCALKVSDHFYGTGESLLFRFSPEFQAFGWTGDNVYFIKGNNESLAIGAGDGKFGLWLDGDLYQGRTQPCNTYANETLSRQEDFVVKTLECWAFV